MPFKSEKQRKYLWANEPEIARDWTDTYGSKIHKADGGRIGFYRGKGTSSSRSSNTSTSNQGPAGGASAGGNYGGNRSGGYSDRERGQQQARTSHHSEVDRGGYTPTHVKADLGPKPTPDRDGIVGYLKNLSQSANRRGLKKNLDHYLGGKKLDFPMLLAALKGPQEEDDYYTEFAGLSPIEMQQRYEGTLSQEDMDRVQHMSSVLGQPNITREDYESAFWGPKGPPQSDTGGE